MHKYLVVIGGATASGKTTTSILIAQTLNCSIISADSRQIYHELNIGTAKPTPEEMSMAPHYLIGHKSIIDEYSVGDYEVEALSLLDQLFEERDFVIAAGGTGLYLKALIDGLDQFPEVPTDIKTYYTDLWKNDGISTLQMLLHQKDPDYAARVDLNNPHRIIRALSVIHISGQSFSSFQSSSSLKRSFIPILINLNIPRDRLYQRINHRVDIMMNAGLLEEVRSLWNFRHLNSLNTVGYREIFKYLEGSWPLDLAVEKIKQHTRNYAKRQMTWFRNQAKYHSFSPDDTQTITRYIEKKTTEMK